MSGEAVFSNLKIVFLVLAALTITGCASAPQPKAQENMREYSAKNGLIVKLKPSFSANETENGFTVEPSDGSNRNVRFPVEIKISLVKGREFSADSLKQKTVGDRKINYRVEKSEGGSGGESYAFTGFEKVSDGYIEYSQILQSETGEPDFKTLWEVIENTSVRKNQ